MLAGDGRQYPLGSGSDVSVAPLDVHWVEPSMHRTQFTRALTLLYQPASHRHCWMLVEASLSVEACSGQRLHALAADIPGSGW
eukprot:359192-Prymnesium_polylepis.1